MESTAGHLTANNIPIVAKSMPPAQRLWGKPRERIMHLLDRSRRQRFTFLNAPAGYGKTTALADWFYSLTNAGEKAAWFAIDRRDRDSKCFWLNFHYAICTALGIDFVKSLGAVQSMARNEAILTMANEMSLSARKCGGLFIVIEGLDVIYGFETLEELLTLMLALSGNVHIILSSRVAFTKHSFPGFTIPDVALNIDYSMLALTKQEMLEYLLDAGVEQVEEPDLNLLHDKTQGWPAGTAIVMDSVDAHFTDEWITKIAAALGERTPDYLVVQHMEPDHSGSVAAFAQAYPGTTIVASAQAFNMMKAYFGTDYADRRVVVKEGDTLPLGTHTLHFVTAPMVHWPEVIMTYDDADKVLFSADAFGKFGALDVEEPWLPEARRYFIGIVGKYGVQVQAVLKKAAALDIETVCSLHGPVLHKEQLGDVLAAYDAWSAYRPETEGVLVAYSSIYGHTAEAANRLAEALREKGVETVAMDLARCDMAEAVAQAFRFSKLVLATPTYNADVFPFMKEFIHHLTERNYQNRTVAFIENGSWAPMAAKVMTKMLEGSKNLTYAATTVTVRGALNAASEAQLAALADELSR